MLHLDRAEDDAFGCVFRPVAHVEPFGRRPGCGLVVEEQLAFVGNLKQVTAFLTDRSVRDLVLARVCEEVGEGTRVVIGHSPGSVVAYEYVCWYGRRRWSCW